MTIEWGAFATVVVAALVSACVVVTLFSLGLRLGDGSTLPRRVGAVACFVVCALVVAVGIVLIVPSLRSWVFG